MKNKKISWQKFATQVRSKGCCLFKSINDFPDAILVAGCQRSGTTIISRVIKNSAEIQSPQFCKDDELSDAMILSGMLSASSKGRHCFQTTYLNECFNEYIESNQDFRLIWVIRNPYSVIYSMMYHWKAYGFNELFYSVGKEEMNLFEKRSYDRLGSWGLSKIHKASMSYVAKNKQLLKLRNALPNDKLYVIDYDRLINNKNHDLENLYKFIDVKYDISYGDKINDLSVNKYKKLSNKQRSIITQRCQATYEEVISLANNK